MADQRNYLLGYGERLTAPILPAGGGGEKLPPYDPEEARTRLAPMMQEVATSFDRLPSKACPRGQAVASITLHPEYLVKSYYPGALLHEAGLRAVGSRASRVKPDKVSRNRQPKEAVTTQLFVTGSRDTFHRLAECLSNAQIDLRSAKELPKIERVEAFDARADGPTPGIEGSTCTRSRAAIVLPKLISDSKP